MKTKILNLPNIKVATLAEKLKEEGYKPILEFDADELFTINELLGSIDNRRTLNKRSDVKLCVVDKSEISACYKPGKVYGIYVR